MLGCAALEDMFIIYFLYLYFHSLKKRSNNSTCLNPIRSQFINISASSQPSFKLVSNFAALTERTILFLNEDIGAVTPSRYPNLNWILVAL